MIIEDFCLVTSPNTLLSQTLTPYNFDVDLNPYDIEETMILLMKNHNGIGISANQVNYNKRVIVVNLADTEPFAMFNPVITQVSTETCSETEGCLSFSNLFLKVVRPIEIEIKFLTSSKRECILRLVNYDARCVLHELDHINGICFVSRVSKPKLDLAIRKMRKYNGGTK